jgi:hypothetical protein
MPTFFVRINPGLESYTDWGFDLTRVEIPRRDRRNVL